MQPTRCQRQGRKSPTGGDSSAVGGVKCSRRTPDQKTLWVLHPAGAVRRLIPPAIGCGRRCLHPSPTGVLSHERESLHYHVKIRRPLDQGHRVAPGPVPARRLPKHGVHHEIAKLPGLFEQRLVTGGREDDHLLARRIQHLEPLREGLRPAPDLISALDEVDGHVEPGDGLAEIDVLQSRCGAYGVRPGGRQVRVGSSSSPGSTSSRSASVEPHRKYRRLNNAATRAALAVSEGDY